jgi:hypothetical protein
MDGIGQWPAQAGMRPHEVVRGAEERQLLTQARFVCAPRVDAPPDGRDRLAQVQIQALDKRRVDRPTPLGQPRLDGLSHAEYDLVLDPHEASPAVGLDDLRIEEPRPWHPAGFGQRPFALTPLGLNPPTVVRNQRDEVARVAGKPMQKCTLSCNDSFKMRKKSITVKFMKSFRFSGQTPLFKAVFGNR